MHSKKQKIGIVIQARMNSTRLPGKVLKEFCGQPLLLFQIQLLKQFNIDATIVIATSDHIKDDHIVSLCKTHRVAYVRGSEDNVFQRFQVAAKQFRFDHIVRITGDNPLTNFRILTTSLERHLDTKSDLTSTRKIRHDRSIERYAPKGNSIDVLNCKSLMQIDSKSLDGFEKEHVIPIFYTGDYRVSYVKTNLKTDFSYSIDNLDDFNRVEAVANQLLKNGTLLATLEFPENSKNDREH